MNVTMAKDYYENPSRSGLPYGQMVKGRTYDLEATLAYELIAGGYATATPTTITATGPVAEFVVKEGTTVLGTLVKSGVTNGTVVACESTGEGNDVIGAAMEAGAQDDTIDVRLIGPLVSLTCGATVTGGDRVAVRSDGLAYEAEENNGEAAIGYCTTGAAEGSLCAVVLFAPLPVLTPILDVIIATTVEAGQTVGPTTGGEATPISGQNFDPLEAGVEDDVIGCLYVHRV